MPSPGAPLGAQGAQEVGRRQSTTPCRALCLGVSFTQPSLPQLHPPHAVPQKMPLLGTSLAQENSPPTSGGALRPLGIPQGFGELQNLPSSFVLTAQPPVSCALIIPRSTSFTCPAEIQSHTNPPEPFPLLVTDPASLLTLWILADGQVLTLKEMLPERSG